MTRFVDDIEDGKINCVVTKDLSRLGRNYILTGQYTEIYFPSKGVRYIAINDNVDTINGENELAPFLNILNEMHARQTSKKVKAAMHTRFANGAHYGAYAPIGYIKDPDKVGHLLVDEETRWIIEKIFDLAVHGAGAARITRLLIEEQIPTPAWYNFKRNGTFAHVFEGADESKAYMWTIAQVKSILKDENYIGNSIHNKQSNISFKNKNSEFEKYKAEAKEKWGDTSAYKEHAEKTKNYSDSKWNDLAEGMDNIMSEFAVCMKNEKTPDCAEAQNLVKTLQNHITENYYLCTNEILLSLGQMYAYDERFKNNIDKHAEGTAAFICKAIEIYCRK